MFLNLFLIIWNLWLLPHGTSSTKQTTILIVTLFLDHVNIPWLCLAGLPPSLINLSLNLRYKCLLASARLYTVYTFL